MEELWRDLAKQLQSDLIASRKFQPLYGIAVTDGEFATSTLGHQYPLLLDEIAEFNLEGRGRHSGAFSRCPPNCPIQLLWGILWDNLPIGLVPKQLIAYVGTEYLLLSKPKYVAIHTYAEPKLSHLKRLDNYYPTNSEATNWLRSMLRQSYLTACSYFEIEPIATAHSKTDFGADAWLSFIYQHYSYSRDFSAGQLSELPLQMRYFPTDLCQVSAVAIREIFSDRRNVREAFVEVNDLWQETLAPTPKQLSREAESARDSVDVSKYSDPDNYERNVWLYRQREAGKTNGETLAELSRKAETFAPLESDNALRSAIKSIAQFHGWPELKGMPGRKKKNPNGDFE